MGRTHSNAYKRVNDFFDLEYRPVLKAVCGRTAEGAKAFAENWGYESIETDWRKLVERKDIDAIDICTPNNTHAEIAIAAAAAGKMILCEKPLSMNLVEGQKMVDAVEKAGVPNTVWYNYRRVPAVTLAKQLIDEGRLGKIFHYRANFLQDWTISADLPQGGTGLWRLDVAAAGSGVTGDLLAHCIDTALWLNGSIDSVCAMTETFIKERKHNLTGKVEPVGIDDACAFLCRFDNGSLGLFESTRYARGHKALYTFEVNGEKASLKWDLRRPAPARVLRPSRRVDRPRLALDPRHRRRHPYMKNWWVPGLQIGYEHTFVHQVADFLENLAKGKPTAPTFRDALATQAVCDAVLDSAEHSKWEIGRAGVRSCDVAFDRQDTSN